MKKWRFTIALGLSYLIIFHVWRIIKPPWIMLSGTAAAAALGFIAWRAWNRGYFMNAWDGVFHAAVILDIFLEGWLIKFHEGTGFYWCAGAFGVVLAAYRFFLSRRLRPGRGFQVTQGAAVGACWFFMTLAADAQEPRDAVSAGIDKLKAAGNFNWVLTTSTAPDDSTPAYLAFPAIRGKTGGEFTSISARSVGGDVEVVKKGEKVAAKLKNQWKTPEEIRLGWLRKSEMDLKGPTTNTAAVSTADSDQINPVDAQTILLGNDPTAVAGMIAPLPPIIVGSGRRAYVRIPPPGASMARDINTNAPAAELPDAATLTEMLLDSLPDPLAEAELILNQTTDLKPVGAGYFNGEIPSTFVTGLAEARKRTGENRAPEVNDAKATVRFWISQGKLYKYQVAIQAAIIVGPTYNPLTVWVDRTTTCEFRGAGVTRLDVPPGAAKLLQ